MDVLLNYALFSIDPEQLVDITEVKCHLGFVLLCSYDCIALLFRPIVIAV